MRRGPSIRYLLLMANAFIVIVPVAAIVFFRLWDTHLVRVTEERLAAESVLVAESWRDLLRQERGEGAAAPSALAGASDEGESVAPIEATLDLNYGVMPPAPPPTRFAADPGSPEWRAGQRLRPLLARARRENLGGIRILDAQGCVVASTAGDQGACLDYLEEVRTALRGHYAAVARQRFAHNPLLPLNPFGRSGAVRVYTAIPVFAAGRVIGAVRMSRTSSSPLEAFWKYRYTVLLGIFGLLLLMATVSFFFSRAISRPVKAITRAAEAIARGEPAHRFEWKGIAPLEVHALSLALNRMTRQLTDRAAYIAGFAANVSHELKTPITGIRGAVELLRDEWDEMSEEQRQRFLRNIDGDASRMERLVTRLLQLARIQSSPEGVETVDVGSFFAELGARYDGRVRIDRSGAPGSICINADHLETAVRNLIDNAVRHGDGKPVEVTVRGGDGRLVIGVRDYGSGISAGNQKRLFERFFTTERDRGGTGLGLAIVQAVAETRGGSIVFETGAEGTTFVLTV